MTSSKPGCCGETSDLVKTAAFLALLGFVVHILAFGTPLWSSRLGESEGLWEKCVGTVCQPVANDPLGSEPWFILTQVLVTITLIHGLAIFIVTFVIVFDAVCVINKSLRIAVLSLAFIAAAIQIVAVLVYAIRGKIFFADFHLDFSWGVALTAAILYAVVGILVSIDLDRIHNCDDEDEDDEDCDGKSKCPDV